MLPIIQTVIAQGCKIKLLAYLGYHGLEFRCFRIGISIQVNIFAIAFHLLYNCGAGCPLLRVRQNYRCSAKYIKKLKILHVKHKNNPLIYKENLYRIDISDKTNDKK